MSAGRPEIQLQYYDDARKRWTTIDRYFYRAATPEKLQTQIKRNAERNPHYYFVKGKRMKLRALHVRADAHKIRHIYKKYDVDVNYKLKEAKTK